MQCAEIFTVVFLRSGEKIYFTKELQDTKVNAIGKSAKLECEISKDGLKLEWFRGSKKLRRGEDYDIRASGKTHTLIVEKVTEDVLGEYRAEYKDLSTSAKLGLGGECSGTTRIVGAKKALAERICRCGWTYSSASQRFERDFSCPELRQEQAGGHHPSACWIRTQGPDPVPSAPDADRDLEVQERRPARLQALQGGHIRQQNCARHVQGTDTFRCCLVCGCVGVKNMHTRIELV